MPISSTPPLEKMTPADAARMVIEEDSQPETAVASSADDLKPVARGFRYRTEPIVGLAKPVRFRSLTLEEFTSGIRDAEGTIDEDALLVSALVDGDGFNYLDKAAVRKFKTPEYDARTWNHLLAIAMTHCLGGSLEDLKEQAAGN